jgi:hypothetical protein
MNIKYTKEMLESAVKSSMCVADVMRKLGVRRSGGSHSHLVRRFDFFNIDTSHFTGKGLSRGRPSPRKKSWREILVLRTTGKRQYAFQLRRALIEYGIPYECNSCKISPLWNSKELRFQVDHINRNWLDDRPNNLQFLCPNCHSQTDGYNGSKGYSDVIDCNRGQRLKRKIKNGTVAQLVGGTSLRS